MKICANFKVLSKFVCSFKCSSALLFEEIYLPTSKLTSKQTNKRTNKRMKHALASVWIMLCFPSAVHMWTAFCSENVEQHNRNLTSNSFLEVNEWKWHAKMCTQPLGFAKQKYPHWINTSFSWKSLSENINNSLG